MQRIFERIRPHFIGFTRLTVSLLSALGLLVSMTAALAMRQVEVVWEDGTKQVFLTSQTTAEDILEDADIEVTANDEVILEDLPSGTKIYIYSLFSVPLLVDGKIYEEQFAIGTVLDVLKEHKIELGEKDMVEPAKETPLSRGMQVKVTRVVYEEVSKRREVLDESVEEFIAALKEEEQASFKRSKSRIYDVKAVDRLEDGKVVSSEILSLTAVYHPSDAAKALPFEQDMARSTIDAFHGVELDEDGIPIGYTRKIEGANTTAYSSSGTGLGAGGQGLYCGTVAVNPNEIPYGTRLYIRSSDGSFIYGYAIASDTGIAMMDGRAAVDLYFESNTECNAFGRRWLDVYVLD